MKRALLALALLGACGQVWAQPVPSRVEMRYSVSLGPLRIGEGVDSLQHDGKTFLIRSESKTVGLAAALYRLNILRESRGLVTPEGLRPEFFSEIRNGQPKRGVVFDWKLRQAILDNGGNKHTEPLLDRTWDATSFGFNFAFDRRETNARDLDVYVTDGRRLTRYRYHVVGIEKVETEIGVLEALHVRKVLEGDDKRAFEVWLGIEQHFLPVRIRFSEKDGTTFESTITRISYPTQ